MPFKRPGLSGSAFLSPELAPPRTFAVMAARKLPTNRPNRPLCLISTAELMELSAEPAAE